MTDTAYQKIRAGLEELLAGIKRGDLDSLIAAGRLYETTPEEKRAQARSWAIGEMRLKYPNMSRLEAERYVDAAIEEGR